jgi:hypothetical protein
MKDLGRFRNHCFTILTLLLIALFFPGCGALSKAQQKREARLKRQKQQGPYMLLERPKSEINTSPDGQKIDSDHYTLSFAEDLKKNKAFDESKERQDWGRGALVYMESLYEYVHDIFGFEPDHRIQVILYHRYRGTNMMAQTVVQYRTIYNGKEYLKDIQGIEIHFPLDMYSRTGTRAHELTHAFTNIYLLPTWFAEGIAVLVEIEYAKDKTRSKLDLDDDLRTDLDGDNSVQNWKGHYTFDNLTQWRYSYSYSIVSELKSRFGDDFYPKLFRLIEADQLHQKISGEMPTSFLVYYLSKAAGQDLVPFFKELKFNVRRLTIADIRATLRQIGQ